MLEFTTKEIPAAVAASVKKTQEWLEVNAELKSKLEDSVGGFDELILAIPSTLDEAYGIVPPWVYLLHEADQELDSTVVLIFSGMYKDALRALRSFIELNLLGILYFSNKDINGFTEWLAGEKQTPPFRQLVENLINQNQNIAKLEQIKWSFMLRTLYRELSQFVHTGGHGGSVRVLRDGNMQAFNQRGAERTTQQLLQAIKSVAAARIACFPLVLRPLPLFEKFGFGGPVTGFFEPDQTDRASRIFKDDEPYAKCLAEIAAEDDDANQLSEAILAMPDLSEGEMMQTFKQWFESMGNTFQKEKLTNDFRGKDDLTIITMAKAMQRSFIKVSFPVLNELMLGILKPDVSENPTD